MDEATKKLDEIQRAFDEFKSKNDSVIAEEVKKGTADVVRKEEVDRINDAITALTSEMKSIEAKANRPGAGDSGLTAEQEEHKAAFNLFVKRGDERKLLELKTISVGTPAEGGYAVPEQIDRNIEKLERTLSPMRSICGQVSVSTPDYKKLVDINGTASGWVGETAARPATATPGLAEVAPSMGEVYANATATQQSLDDLMFDVEAWIANSVAEEFAIAEDIAFISGNGTNKPTGFLNGTPVATADSSRAFGVLQYVASGQAAAMPTSADTFIDIVHSMKSQYRNGAVWVTNTSVAASLRKYKDTTNQYLWQPSIQAGQPSLFMGYGLIEDENMPAVAANAFSLAFGNFQRGYLIVDRIGTRMLRDPYTNKPHVQFYFTKRVGGKVVNSEAIKLLKIAAS